MNYRMSVLFRSIPLAMAAFCFGLGGFIFFGGGDPARLTAGAVVFFLGSICIALYATAATIIRQLVGTYRAPFTWLLPVLGYSVALFTLGFGIWMFAAHPDAAPLVVGGHVVSGLGLISVCVSTTWPPSTRRPKSAPGRSPHGLPPPAALRPGALRTSRSQSPA